MAIWCGSGTEGAFVAEAAALISAFDHGFTVGDGVFETMKVRDGRLFLWPWHLERLQRSAEQVRIALPSAEFLTDVVTGVARASAADVGRDARVRLTVSAGLGPLGSDRLPSAPTVVCAAAPVPIRPAAARIRFAAWPRNEHSPLAGIKSTSYAEHVLALAAARAEGADEAVFCNIRGFLCEGTASNVFVVQGRRVSTPPAAAGILEGVTRRFVLGLATADLPIHERNITRDEFLTADEVFLTSSLQDIRGVESVDGRSLSVGPVTALLRGRFLERAEDDRCWT